MAVFCIKCGASLGDDMRFCNKCGAPVPVQETKPGMSLEESRKLAEELKGKFAEYERTEHDISEAEARLKELGLKQGGQVSWFRHFWPTLLVAPALLFVSRWLVRWLFNLEIISEYGLEIWAWIPYILSLAAIILGIVFACRNTNKANANVEAERASIESRRKKLREELEDITRKRETLGKELSKYDNIIPERYRNSASMNKVIYLLDTGRAKDFEEAVRKLLFT